MLARAASSLLPVTVHAEDPLRFSAQSAASTLEEWDRSRPADAELSAIDRLLPSPPGLRLHVAHVTTEAAAVRLSDAGVSYEVAPHHLFLSSKAAADPRRKVNPPLRSDAERARLWERFRSGRVPIVASDHAPHSIADKERPFPLAPSGVPGVETMVPLLLARVRAGELALPTFLRAACDRPARWFGIPMGRLAVGHRANLLAVDFRDRHPITAKRLRTRCAWTPFEGWEGIFPRFHWRDGEPLVEEGEFVGRKDGTIVRPEYVPSN